jgi:hypothetical protein
VLPPLLGFQLPGFPNLAIGIVAAQNHGVDEHTMPGEPFHAEQKLLLSSFNHRNQSVCTVTDISI